MVVEEEKEVEGEGQRLRRGREAASVVVVEEGEGRHLRRGREAALVVEVAVDVARRSSRERKQPPRQRSRRSLTFFRGTAVAGAEEGRSRGSKGELGWKMCVLI